MKLPAHAPKKSEKRVIAHVPKGISLASGFSEGSQVWVGITGFHIFAPGTLAK